MRALRGAAGVADDAVRTMVREYTETRDDSRKVINSWRPIATGRELSPRLANSAPRLDIVNPFTYPTRCPITIS